MWNLSSLVSSLNIKQKASVAFVLIAFFACAAVGVSAGYVSSDSAVNVQKQSLSALRDARRDELVDYLETIDQDLELWSQSPVTIEALESFSDAWSAIEQDPKAALQRAYITDNPHPLGEKDKLTDASTAPSDYAAAHSEHHGIFNKLKDVRGYYDVFLINADGDLVYSVYKELDYATNLVRGEYANSGLGEAYRRAMAGETAFVDFAPYAPSHGAAASFIAGPLKDAEGATIGALAFQMPIDRMDAILSHNEALGDKGALLVVGPDGLLRHNSAKFGADSILNARVETSGVARAVNGEAGVATGVDAYGVPVLEAFTPIEFHGVRWAFIAEEALDYVYRPVRDMQYAIGLTTLVVMAVVAVVSWLMAIVAARPIIGIKDAVLKLSDGIETDVPGNARQDEIGELARSMERVYQKGLEAARLRSALDDCSTMVMVTNRRQEIVYCNNGLRKVFSENQSAIRADLPNFDAQKVLGESIDQFHKAPAETRGRIEALTGTHKAKIMLGDLRFELSITPVTNDSGERIGTVVEWIDKTAELRAGEEIDLVVAAAMEGDFSKRAKLTNAPPVWAAMGERLNQIADSVEKGVQETSRVVQLMADGDLRDRMKGDFRGAFAELQSNVNATIDRLGDLLGQITSTGLDVQKSTKTILQGAEDLSSRAEQQASSLEETAATMEEMSASIKSNADSSASAKTLAATASERAGSGGEIVNQAVSSMSEIEQGSSKISDIISVIDGIAFQTNLLALNAAVEAARAGDAGKGFAVVASEVRALAQRSSDASRDIRELIQTSADQVSEGVRLVTQTGDSLAGIVNAIEQVEASIMDIASASVEQASGAQEISSAVSHMDEMTQQNASLADQSAANARALAEGAEKLRALISFFKVDGVSAEASKDEAWRSVEATKSTESRTVAPRQAPATAPATPPRPVAAASAPSGDWADF